MKSRIPKVLKSEHFEKVPNKVISWLVNEGQFELPVYLYSSIHQSHDNMLDFYLDGMIDQFETTKDRRTAQIKRAGYIEAIKMLKSITSERPNLIDNLAFTDNDNPKYVKFDLIPANVSTNFTAIYHSEINYLTNKSVLSAIKDSRTNVNYLINLYCYLKMQITKLENMEMPTCITFQEISKISNLSVTTIQTYINILIKIGMIKKISGKSMRRDNIYSLSYNWIQIAIDNKLPVFSPIRAFQNFSST